MSTNQTRSVILSKRSESKNPAGYNNKYAEYPSTAPHSGSPQDDNFLAFALCMQKLLTGNSRLCHAVGIEYGIQLLLG